MITIGVDYHKRTSTFNVVDHQGTVTMKRKIVNSRDSIRDLISSIDGPKRIAIEATRSWDLFYDNVHDLADEFCLGHPRKIKALCDSNTKNDKTDASNIAWLAHKDILPKVFIAPQELRQLRYLYRFRIFLVNQRRSIRNHIHSLLDRNIWPVDRPASFKNIFCKRGRAWLESLKLPDNDWFILQRSLDCFDNISSQITQIEAALRNSNASIPGLDLLRTVPGFKQGINAYCVLLEIGDIARFRKATGLAHYAGLIPREYSSGDKVRFGRLIKQANMTLRTAMIESTFAALRSDPALRTYYKSVKDRSGSGAAVVATARKLCKSIHAVLKERKPYRSQMFPPATACHPSNER